MKPYCYILLLALFNFQCRHKTENTTIQFPGKPAVPSSIIKEHEILLNQIHKLSLFEDSAGLAAKKLYSLMEHHFKEEEDVVLPQLGLLPLLANEKLPGQIKEIIQLSEKLKSHLTHLNVEHQLIEAYLGELKQVAAKKDLPEINDFEKELRKHANTEEEIFFPAAVLIVEYLKLKSM